MLPATLDVSDIHGNRVIEQDLTEVSDATLDVQILPTGVYVLSLRQGTHIVRKKIVKE